MGIGLGSMVNSRCGETVVVVIASTSGVLKTVTSGRSLTSVAIKNHPRPGTYSY